MTTATRPLHPAFTRNQDGAVAIMFGIMFLAFTFAAGMGLDLARFFHTSSRVGAAADAAVLAAGREMMQGKLTDAQIEQMATKLFQENLKAGGGNYGVIVDATATLDRKSGTVTFLAKGYVDMTLTRIAGFDKAPLNRTAIAQFEQKDIELSMALDVTGSMCEPSFGPCTNGPKISALKSASSEMFDILMPDQGSTNTVRVALAPYSSGVNAGGLAAVATNGHSKNGCAFEREGTTPLGEQAPSFGNYLRAAGDLPVAATATCSNSAIVQPLSDDKSLLKSSVNSYAAVGSTAGHLGIQWAWYLLSPEWSSVLGGAKPANYNDGKTMKVAVLMTDGLFNTIDGKHHGDDSGQATSSQNWARSICTSMRGKGVMVYTVGFALSAISNPARRARAEATLRDCAGSSDRYFPAEDATALRAAFQQIAQEINTLRITK